MENRRLPSWDAKAAVSTILGAIVALLGLLWFVQGLGIVRIGPILCVAECEPLTGRSVQWTVIGALALVLGIGLVWAGQRHVRRELGTDV